jgi:glycopeptide antibiotics resistance protein
MQYVERLFPAFPIVCLVAALIYAILFLLFKGKREKPGKLNMLAEFVLVGWVCMFVYTTLLMGFGNGMGEAVNLKPFGDFAIAFRYGSGNAHLVWQSLLNILMMAPLGFLLPVVFPHKIRNFKSPLLVSFFLSATAEIMQLFVGRGCDIDDVIANTAGGLCGFALWAIAYEAMTAFGGKPSPHPARKIIAGTVVLCLTAAPFIAISVSDGNSEYGNFYYGHMIPEKVNVPDSISREESTGNLYKATTHFGLQSVEETLKNASGVNGEFTSTEWQDVWALAENIQGRPGETTQLFIYQYNTWSVNFHYPARQSDDEPEMDDGPETDVALLPKESEALDIAWEKLSPYGITAGNVRYTGIIDGYGNEKLHLGFESLEDTDAQMVYGNVVVAIGENGDVYSIDDKRIWCDFVKKVPCISPYEATQLAHKVGVGIWSVTADVSTVDKGYSLIDETGYVIPTWNISARTSANGGGQSGNQTEWNPTIDAVK